MTLEELEFFRQHPGFAETLVPTFLAELKRHRLIKEGAKRAVEQGIARQWLPTEKRQSASKTAW